MLIDVHSFVLESCDWSQRPIGLRYGHVLLLFVLRLRNSVVTTQFDFSFSNSPNVLQKEVEEP